MENLEKEKIRSILDSPVVFIHKSTKEEKDLYSDKKVGWFYTFGLESGQIFVSHFQPMEKYSDTLVSTFKPFNSLLPDLKEINFKTRFMFNRERDIEMHTQYHPRVSENEQKVYDEIIASKYNGNSYEFIPLYQKSWPIHFELARCAELRKELLHHQKLLKKELTIQNEGSRIPERCSSHNQTEKMSLHLKEPHVK